jgi:hypothetical protein
MPVPLSIPDHSTWYIVTTESSAESSLGKYYLGVKENVLYGAFISYVDSDGWI